jgi:PKD repeat protein
MCSTSGGPDAVRFHGSRHRLTRRLAALCALTAGIIAAVPTAGAQAAPTPPQVSTSSTPSSPATGLPIQFSAGAQDPDKGPIAGWAWDFNEDGIVDSTSQNPTYPGYATPGDHVVKLVVTDHDHERTTDERIVHVHVGNRAPLVANLHAQPLSARIGHPAAFQCDCSDPDADPRLASPLSYDWDFGDGSTHSAAPRPSHSYLTTGVHTVKLTVTDDQGARATNTMTVRSHAGNEPPAVSGPSTLTATSRVATTLTAIAVDDATAPTSLTYDWNFGDGTAHGTNATPSHTYGTAGDYVVKLKVTDGEGGSTMFSQVVHVSRPAGTPTASFTTSFDLASTFFFDSTGAAPATGEPIPFQDGSTDPDGPIAAHHWDFGDGQSSTEDSPTHSYTTAGDYVVVLTVTDGQGHVASDSSVMHVHNGNLPAAVAAGASVDAPRTGRAVTLSGFLLDPEVPDAAGATYDWDFGDGSAHSTQAEPVHTWTAAGYYDIVLTVTDAGGAVSRAAFTLRVHDANEPPEAHPSADPSYPGTDQTVQFFDNSIDTDGDLASYAWTFGDGTSATGKEPTHVYSSPGDYRVTETVTDSDTTVASQIVTVHVGPIPPANTVLPVLQGSAKDRQTLTATAGAWTGTAPLTYTFDWVRCDASGTVCAVIADASITTTDETATYRLGEADIGHVIRARVSAVNIAGAATANSGASEVVSEVPPENTAAPSLSGAARDGALLSAAPGTWDHTGTLQYAYAWLRCDTTAAACAPIARASSQSYRLTPADEGHVVLARVTATDPHGSASADTLPSGVVDPGPPVKLADPAIAGTPRDGVRLSEDDGQFGGSPATAVTRVWERCDSAGANCVQIGSDVVYDLTPADVGHRIRVLVTVDNALGSDSGASAATAVVAPAPPALLDPPAVSGNTVDGQTLSADTGSFSGTPTISYAYRWQRCDIGGATCSDIAGATASRYTLTPADVGHRLRIRITAANAGGTALGVSQTTAAIAALAPTNTALPVIAGAAREGALVIATTGTFTGTAPRFTYRWMRCDAALDAQGQPAGCAEVSGAFGPSLRQGASEVGHRLVVEVTAVNSAGSAAATSAPSPIVEPGPPVTVAAPAVAELPRVGARLVSSPGAFAGTGPLTVSHQWWRCDAAGAGCITIAGATSATYTPAESDIGRTLRLEARGVNALGTVSTMSPPTATVVPAFDVARARRALMAALAPTRSHARARVVLRQRGYTASFDQRFGVGKIDLRWYAKRGGRSVLLARGTRALPAVGRTAVSLKLTGAGRTLLRKARGRLVLTGSGSFSPRVGSRVAVQRRLILSAR